MSTKMRQVTKEEFEVLTKFHPGEVRYYVDVNKALATRNKGARVNVRRKPIKVAPKKRGKGKGGNQPHGGNRANASLPIQLTVKSGTEMRPNTLQYTLYCDVTRVLNEDPTKVMVRSDLTKKLVARNPNLNKASQIVPTLSALITNGYLRYTGS